MVQGSVARHSGPLASVSRRCRGPRRARLWRGGVTASRVPTEAAGLAGALTDAPCASGGRFEPRATCPRGVPPRRTEPRTAGRPALSGNSPQALDRCRERSLLERVPGSFRTSATARFTLAGVNRASYFFSFFFRLNKSVTYFADAASIFKSRALTRFLVPNSIALISTGVHSKRAFCT